MTAGLPVTLEGLVGANGKVFGMPSFGFSAPYKVLDENSDIQPKTYTNRLNYLWRNNYGHQDCRTSMRSCRLSVKKLSSNIWKTMAISIKIMAHIVT